MIISSDSTADNTEVIPETPETTLILDSSKVDASMTQPPKVSLGNVIMGEDNTKTTDQGIASTQVSDSFTSLPPQITPIFPITSTTDSPTFQHVINTPFTSIFSSQSTDPPKPNSPVDDTMLFETETDKEGFGGAFEDLKFDAEEEAFPDHMLMTMKQFKILNSKLNSILQSQADIGGGSLVSSLEVDSLLNVFESRVIR